MSCWLVILLTCEDLGICEFSWRFGDLWIFKHAYRFAITCIIERIFQKVHKLGRMNMS